MSRNFLVIHSTLAMAAQLVDARRYAEATLCYQAALVRMRAAGAKKELIDDARALVRDCRKAAKKQVAAAIATPRGLMN